MLCNVNGFKLRVIDVGMVRMVPYANAWRDRRSFEQSWPHMTTCDAEEGSRIQGYTWKRELYVYVMCDTSDYRAGMIAECCPTWTSVAAASLISMTVPRGTTLLVTELSNGWC